jgi:hypothetical protein
MPRLVVSEKKADLLKKRQQIEAQLKDLKARERETSRKEDTRRKVIAGAIALEHLERNDSTPWTQEFCALLDKYVDARARYLFPVLSAAPAKPKAKNGAAADPSQHTPQEDA